MVDIAIISGGTATNSILDVIQELSGSESHIGSVSHILPVSDNGGSTSEIIRVLGGCSVGDLRSRIVRLIPDKSSSLRELLSHRLSANSKEAKSEWELIVDGSHELWDQVEPACKEIIRSFLIHVHMEILKRSRNSAKNFRFELASVGNLFLTGARLFCGSLDSAVELILRVARAPSSINVIPCLNTNFTYHISALLKDGTIITGQSQISHPSRLETSKHPIEESSLPYPLVRSDSLIHPPPITPSGRTSPVHKHPLFSGSTDQLDSQAIIYGQSEPRNYPKLPESDSEGESEFAVPSYIHPDLKKSQLHVDKDDTAPLPAPIDRIFYISPYGEEIYPTAQSRVINCLSNSNVIVYSIGSLMTSIIPVLILQGVGEAILENQKKKVLLLNGCLDRETQSLDALGFIQAIHNALAYSMRLNNKRRYGTSQGQELPYSSFVTHLIHLNPSKEVVVDTNKIEGLQIRCVGVLPQKNNPQNYDQDDLRRKLQSIANE
ncbi:hypothetical protein OGAPHI_002635 [Ogataea philodendri]|uniref:Uncharacterized protein n=1 Tax=Ogataea philodendri TaxID=1378263 RepID=A0A9P8PBY4_9ASCO|nr:uncharacterized protein OGAPHI_002635 [Ogataea philodendri]KAH3668880.1 hypothetical protein OGAPHI_002635 [Ogataea philodendri]